MAGLINRIVGGGDRGSLVPPPALSTVEDKLLYLKHWGDVSVSWMKDGWYGRVSMNVNAAGVQFEVKSNFDHKSPGDALDVVITRMRDALKQLGVDVDATMKGS